MEREDGGKASEVNYTKTDGSVDLRALITGLSQKMLGKALDYARISGMSDRSFTQYSRSLKDEAYQLAGFGLKILEDSGQITRIPDSKQ